MARRSQQRVQRGQSLQKGLFTAVWCGGSNQEGRLMQSVPFVGRYNKAMTTTLLNTTGYEFISSLAQCTRAASVVQQ